MLLHGVAALREAAATGTALGAFTAYNLETAQAICAAGEAAGEPVILQAGASAFRHAGRRPLAELAVAAASAAATPVGVHLDHSRDLEEISACIELGYTSVMVDGSHLPFAENAELTSAVVERAHAAGVWVEAELGAVAGDEDRSSDARAGACTDAGRARRFAEATGVDALAVAVGNVHGFMTITTELDLDRLAEIAEACRAPLVLHGASGVPAEQLLGAVDRGVVKVNVNAELRRAFLDRIAEALDAARDGYDLAGLLGAARSAVETTARDLALLLARRPVPA